MHARSGRFPRERQVCSICPAAPKKDTKKEEKKKEASKPKVMPVTNRCCTRVTSANWRTVVVGLQRIALHCV